MRIEVFHNEKGWGNPRVCHYCQLLLSYKKDGTAFAILDDDQPNNGDDAHQWVCIDCIKELHAKIEEVALTALVMTGIDIKTRQ